MSAEIVHLNDFRRCALNDGGRARIMRRRANLRAERAFWTGPPDDLAMGRADPELQRDSGDET